MPLAGCKKGMGIMPHALPKLAWAVQLLLGVCSERMWVVSPRGYWASAKVGIPAGRPHNAVPR